MLIFNTSAEPQDILSKVVAFTLKLTHEEIRFRLASACTGALLIFKINGISLLFSKAFLNTSIPNVKLHNTCPFHVKMKL